MLKFIKTWYAFREFKCFNNFFVSQELKSRKIAGLLKRTYMPRFIPLATNDQQLPIIKHFAFFHFLYHFRTESSRTRKPKIQ